MKLTDITRKPDRILICDEESAFRFEEGEKSSLAKIDYLPTKSGGTVVINPCPVPVKYAKLRWNEPICGLEKMLGDQWERSGGEVGHEWTGVIPHKIMPWYFHCVKGEENAFYGVKTGANAFCAWQVDSKGLTLYIDLTCGDGGTLITSPLTLCETVSACFFGDAFLSSEKFCALMCDKPVLPKSPVFGVNNWYWAYGNISHESIMVETDYLLLMTKGAVNKPYMILDDGWQASRRKDFNGGPWDKCNDKFTSMSETAQMILEKGALPGIWFRPLYTVGSTPLDAMIKTGNDTDKIVLDPSHPYTIEKIESDTRRIAEWGYKLIKHDFTSIDITGAGPIRKSGKICRDGVRFYDNKKTTAMLMKDCYNAVQRGAGESEVIGCNTVGHLTAGIHSIQRVGNDTSGRSFEWTRRFGINSMMRLGQNGTFFNVDPDCAAFTERVPISENLDFLEVCALTGMTTLASVTPGMLKGSDLERINSIYKMASENKSRHIIAGYTDTVCPEKFVSRDGSNVKEYDWYSHYNGVRNQLDWFN